VIRPQFERLIASFNRGLLDIPDGFLTPQTAFSLNGRAYELLLGGSPDDPLIRLLARGAAAYRTAAKALQYAVRSPAVTIESFSERSAQGPGNDRVATAELRVEGLLRDDGDRFELRAASDRPARLTPGETGQRTVSEERSTRRRAS
jgi:hypothetical protein